jgi:Family of unknown function (DUF6412)
LPGALQPIGLAAIGVPSPDQRRITEEAVVAVILGELVSLAVASWHLLAQSVGTPSGLMVMAGFVLGAAIFAAIVSCTRVARASAGRSLLTGSIGQQMDRQAAALRRQFDPDAAGRARPRAPAMIPAAA